MTCRSTLDARIAPPFEVLIPSAPQRRNLTYPTALACPYTFVPAEPDLVRGSKERGHQNLVPTLRRSSLTAPRMRDNRMHDAGAPMDRSLLPICAHAHETPTPRVDGLRLRQLVPIRCSVTVQPMGLLFLHLAARKGTLDRDRRRTSTPPRAARGPRPCPRESQTANEPMATYDSPPLRISPPCLSRTPRRSQQHGGACPMVADARWSGIVRQCNLASAQKGSRRRRGCPFGRCDRSQLLRQYEYGRSYDPHHGTDAALCARHHDLARRPPY